MDFTEAYPHTCSTVGAAARNGDLIALQTLVWNGRPVDVKDNRGWRPIHEAAFHGHPGCLEFLLRQEATDVDWTTFAEETAVLLASRRGHLECLRVLISADADINITTNEGFSPLYEAVQCENLDCVKLLVKKGADVNSFVYTGYTPLHLAAERGFVAAVAFLVSHGASLTLSEDNGLTPVFLAAHMGRADCLRTLLKMAKEKNQMEVINKAASDNATPLLIAAQEGHVECVKVLLEFHADPNVPVRDVSAVALQYAIYKNHFRCFDLLLESTDMSRFTSHFCAMHPLVLALQRKDTRFVRALLQSSLDCHMALPFDASQAATLDILTSYMVPRARGTVLCHVLPDWPLEATRVLLLAGVSPNAQSEDQLSPLLVALWRKAPRLTKLLLAMGASPNVKVKQVYGNAPMILAILNCLDLLPPLGVVSLTAFQDVWTLLLHGGEMNSVFQQCRCLDWVENGQLSLLQLLKGQSPSKIKPLILLLLSFCYHVDLSPNIAAVFSEGDTRELERAAGSTKTLAHICRQQILLRMAKSGATKADVESLKLPETVLDFLLHPNVLCGGQLLSASNFRAEATNGTHSTNGPMPMAVDHQ